MTAELRYWSVLHSDLKPHVLALRDEWKNLLDDPSTTEPTYQKFLQDNAGFFWADGVNCVVVLSQVRLGRDYVTDFVLGYDRGSLGLHYELVEIESPHEPAYTRGGKPSRRLNAALEQVSDWKYWINANREEAKRVFPSSDFLYDMPSFSYTVVIGRRSDGDDQRLRRNRKAASLGVAIRSFDWLSDRVTGRIYLDTFETYAHECSRLPVAVRNQLASPFNTSISDGDWRAISRSAKFKPFHSVPLNAELLIPKWSQSYRLSDFDAAWSKLSDARRASFAQTLEESERH